MDVKMVEVTGVFVVLVTSDDPKLILRSWVIQEPLKIRCWTPSKRRITEMRSSVDSVLSLLLNICLYEQILLCFLHHFKSDNLVQGLISLHGKNRPNHGYNVQVHIITLLLYEITWFSFMGSKLLISVNSLTIPLCVPLRYRITLEISDFLKKNNS